jgi:hypothetical protein
MSSALWASPPRKLWLGGGTGLGQAAPSLDSLPAGTFFDIVPLTSKTLVTGSMQDSNGTTQYMAAQLAGVLGRQVSEPLGDYFPFEDTAVVISFSTDSSLKTAKGWDHVTGAGTPCEQSFADFF